MTISIISSGGSLLPPATPSAFPPSAVLCGCRGAKLSNPCAPLRALGAAAYHRYRELLRVMKVLEDGGTLKQDEWEVAGEFVMQEGQG